MTATEMDKPDFSLRLQGPLELTMGNIGGFYIWTQHDYNNLLKLLTDINMRLQDVQSRLSVVQTQETKAMAALDDLTAQVAANTSLEQSAITLIQGLAKQIADAVSNNDSSALQALSSQLNSSAAALAAAVTANTPPVPPAPAPDPNAPQVNPQSARR
jgi:uncharacterized phage infection (PIP) family protein YhgE